MSASPTLTELKSAAKQLREGGFALCRVDPGEKKPTYQGWSTKSVEPKDFTVGSSIGIQGGPLSDGNTPGHALVIVDLDAEAAVTTADDHLPETGMIEGRSGKPRSHRYFLVPLDSIPAWATSNAPQGAKAAKETKGHAGPFKKAFQHSETGKTVIDFIGTGGQAVCPPSLHTSGEPREWEGGTPGSPAIVEFVDLWRAVCELAIGCGCTIPHTHEAKPRPSRQATRSPENLTERARGYLAKMDAAISGCGGRSKLFTAARAMVWGFDLDHETAFSLLFNDYNPRCVPPWDERDIRAKIDEVERVPFSKARGHLRDEQKSTTSSRPTAGSSSGCPEAPSEHSPNPDDGSESSQQLPVEHFVDIEPSLDTSDFVENLLTREGLSVVYGPSNAGKSFWVLDLALHVAWGRTWCGREVEQGGVLYLAMEGGRGIRNRVAAFKRAHTCNAADMPFAVVPVSVNLLDPAADTHRVIEAVRIAANRMGVPISLIIADTLARAMSGGNENSSEDMGALVTNAGRISQEVKAHVMFIHHSGKDEARGARGHSSLRAATDTEIEVIRDSAARLSTVRVTKQRDLDCSGEFAFRLESIELGTNSRGKTVTSCVVREVEMPSRSDPELSKDQQTAWAVLATLIAESGVVGFTGTPSEVRSVPEAWWRERFYKTKGNATPDTKKHAFQRCVKHLATIGRVFVSSDRVWIRQQEKGASGSDIPL